MERSSYKYLLAPAVLGYWLVCFAPYHWVAPVHNFQNDAYLGSQGVGAGAVAGTDAEQTLHFGGQGLATIEIQPTGVDDQTPETLFLSLHLECDLSEQFGPARLVSFSDHTLSRNFMLGHQGTALVLRWLRPGSDSNGAPNFVVADYFSECKPRHLELTADRTGLVLKSEGIPLLQVPSVSMERWIEDYPVRLGNEGTWNRGWIGQMSNLQLQIDDRVIADGWDQLQLPENEWRLTQSIRNRTPIGWLPFSKNTNRTSVDIILNVVGFLPFGALLGLAWPRRMNLWKAGAFSALLSLTIEVGQLGFEGRFTSSTDLVANTVGGTLGYLLANYLWPSKTLGTRGSGDE